MAAIRRFSWRKRPFILPVLAKLDKLHTDVRALDFSQDGRYLFSSTWFYVYRWDSITQTVEKLRTEHWGIVNDLKVSPDGRELLTISRHTDSAVLSLDTATGKTIRNFGRHQLCGSAIDISRQGNYLLTTSDDASVRIWSFDATSEVSK